MLPPSYCCFLGAGDACAGEVALRLGGMAIGCDGVERVARWWVAGNETKRGGRREKAQSMQGRSYGTSMARRRVCQRLRCVRGQKIEDICIDVTQTPPDLSFLASTPGRLASRIPDLPPIPLNVPHGMD